MGGGGGGDWGSGYLLEIEPSKTMLEANGMGMGTGIRVPNLQFTK